MINTIEDIKSRKVYDPRMHSAEHILNQSMIRKFGCNRSFSSHLESKKSKCDYKFHKALNKEDENILVEEVNKIIDEGLFVTEKIMPIDEAKKICDMSKLPSHVKNDVRIISIGDYDICPCIGEHVKNTSEIGIFSIVSTKYDNGILRIIFKV